MNLHRAVSAILSNRFSSDNLKVLMIQEPRTFKGEIKSLHNNRKVICDISNERLRSCVVL